MYVSYACAFYYFRTVLLDTLHIYYIYEEIFIKIQTSQTPWKLARNLPFYENLENHLVPGKTFLIRNFEIFPFSREWKIADLSRKVVATVCSFQLEKLLCALYLKEDREGSLHWARVNRPDAFLPFVVGLFHAIP